MDQPAHVGWVRVWVAAFLDSSPAAFQALRLLGGAYVFNLGYRAVTAHAPARATAVPATIGAARTAGATAAVAPTRPEPPRRRARPAFTAGLVCRLSNPKTGLLILALLPQFTPPGAGAVFVALGLMTTVPVLASWI